MKFSKQSVGLAALMLLAAVVTASAIAAVPDDDPAARILGNWLTEPKDGIIQISRAGDGLYEGRIVGGSHPGRLDEKNPDVSLRQKALLGQAILHGLQYDGEGKWSGGTIYDPDSGRTYKCRVEFAASDVLKVRGFIGFSLLGKSQLWTRYLSGSMDLSAKP